MEVGVGGRARRTEARRGSLSGRQQEPMAPLALVHGTSHEPNPVARPVTTAGTLEPDELARRVNAVLAAVQPALSREARLSWIQGILVGSGHVVTALWWNNLLDGVANPVSRPEVLKRISERAGIDACYFIQPDTDRGDRIEAGLELLTVLRELQSKPSRRSLGGAINTEELRQLTGIICAQEIPSARQMSNA